MKLTTQLNQAVSAFFDNQLSTETKRAYQTDLKHFAAWTNNLPVNAINQTHVIKYREHLIATYEQATVIRRLAAVRGFFRHLLQHRLISIDPTAGVKLPSKPDNANTEALTDTEVRSMLESCDQTTDQGQWEYALLMMLAYLGLRRSELCSLTAKSIGDERGVATLKVLGKGSKVRILPLPENVLLALHRIPRAHSIKDSQLLIRPKNKTLKPDHIYYAIKKIAQRVGVTKNITPHSFRATFVSNAIDQGCNPMQVQYACGWADTKQITRYDKRRSEIHKSAVWKIAY